MAERLTFDLFANDRASAGFAAAGRSAKAAAGDVDELWKKLQKIDRQSAEARLGLKGNKEALAALDKFDLRLDATGRKVAKPDVTLDGFAKASAEIASLDVALDKLGKKTEHPVVDAASKLQGAGGPAWLGPALLGLPAVTSLLGVATGAAIGLAGAFVAGAGALAGFGAVAKPVLSSALAAEQAVTAAQNNYQATIAAGVPKAQAQAALQLANTHALQSYNAALAGGAKPASALAAYQLTLSKNQATYNSATNAGTFNAKAYAAEQLAIGKAYADLSPQQITLSKQLGAMASAWDDVKAAFTPLIAGSLQPWLAGITSGVKLFGLVIKPMVPVVTALGVQFDMLVTSDAFKTFIKWVGTTGSAVVSSAGSAIMNLISGLVALLPQFTPLIDGAANGVLSWSLAFSHWASSKKAADQIHAFLQWFHDNGPVVAGLLKNIGGALKALAPGLGPGGTLELKAFSDFFALIARLPPSLAEPLVLVAGALLTLNKIGVVTVGVKFVGLAGGPAALGGAAIGAGLILRIREDIKNGFPLIISDIGKLFMGGTGFISVAASGWADAIIAHFEKPLRAMDDRIGHAFTSTFDGIRHDISAHWDEIWADTRAKVLRGVADVEAQFDSQRHVVLARVDGMRADIAREWDTIWRNTIGRIQAGIADAAAWFRSLPGRLTQLSGFGNQLNSFAKNALNLLLEGFKSVAVSIYGWFTSFVSKILGFFSKLLHSSPTGAFYDMGRNMMEGLAMGLKDHAHLVGNALTSHAVPNVGSGVARWTGVVQQALKMEGLSEGLTRQVLYQISTESGGNPNAINLTDVNAQAGDPSRGLLQTIMATFQAYHWPGTSGNIYDPLANVAAAINYARHVYGPSLMSNGSGLGSGHGYDMGGLLPPGLSLALNTTGKAEVVAPGGMGRVEALLAQLVGLHDELCNLVAANNDLTAAAPARTGAGLGAALAGGARAATYRALYSEPAPGVSVYPDFYELTYEGIDFLVDSLVIGESIELIGSVASVNPLCAGAVFLLQPGYDLGSPQPVTSIVGSMLLDGSRPFGYQAGNRTITLPIEISVPGDSGTPAGFQTLIAAREVLLREINQQTWTLRWTRDPGPGGTALPLLFDCFRAHATVVAWGGVDTLNRFPIGLLTVSFDALPYGRSDVPVVVDFPSPLSGRTAPPAAVNIDTFSSVSGTQWAASGQSPVSGGQSAFWDPTITPAFNPQGTGLSATYTKGSLSLNLAAGWSALCNATGTTTTFIVSSATAVTAGIDIGDQFQLWTNAPALIQAQVFTVTKISPVIPGGGNVTVTYTPASLAAPVSTNSAIQTGPPGLNAVTFWAGFGSTWFYQNWARLGGRVTFAVTLTDTYSTALSFSKTVKCTGSNSSLNPRWNKIRIPVPYQAGFDYANVASYSMTIANRGTGDLRYTQLYLSALMAVPPPAVVAPSSARGTVYELAGLPGTARAPVSLQFQQSGTKAYVRQLTVQGANQQWLCPPGVSTVAVFAIGGGGSGAGNSGSQAGGGGGGGGSAANAAVAVTAGKSYSFTVGNGGFYVAGGAAGTASSFTGDSVTVTANGGGGGTISAGGAGGAAGTGGFAGGTGGAGVASTNSGGGGGGSSGGTGGAGNNGAAGSGANGGAGGAAVAGGGNGGKGGSHSTATNGAPPTSGYGGGGGGGPQPGRGASGAGGMIQLTYTATLPAFQTLLVHRPPPDSPYALVPFVSPDPGDTPNGTIQYPVGSLVPGVPARFAGTYTVVLGVWSWHTPANSRTLTVTVTQFEQPGGASYTASASTAVIPNNLPSCPGTNAGVGPLVTIGEITLPVQDMPQDQTAAYFTVSVTSTDTADSFMDVLLLDTMGSTVIIQSATSYGNMFLDEPPSDRDLGLILGSLYDRGDAVSVLDRAVVAGGPMSVDPDGNPLLLAYCAEGAPNAQLVFHPRWHLDRIM